MGFAETPKRLEELANELAGRSVDYPGALKLSGNSPKAVTVAVKEIDVG